MIGFLSILFFLISAPGPRAKPYNNPGWLARRDSGPPRYLDGAQKPYAATRVGVYRKINCLYTIGCTTGKHFDITYGILGSEWNEEFIGFIVIGMYCCCCSSFFSMYFEQKECSDHHDPGRLSIEYGGWLVLFMRKLVFQLFQKGW